VNKRQKDVLLSLHHHLTTLEPGGRSDRVGKLTRVTPQTIDKQIALFKGHIEVIRQCSGFLQVTVVCDAGKHNVINVAAIEYIGMFF